MSPPVFTTVVAMTTSPVFYTAIFKCHPQETPTTAAACEATSARDNAVSDVGESSSGFVDDGSRLGDDLYLPTICWDPNAQDKRYQPKRKIAESSRLIFPPVVHHWVDRAYPPTESAYKSDAGGYDNNELHQVRVAIQELLNEKYHLESQLQAAGLRESRFVSEKNKVEDDLKRVTTHLAKERILWASDIAEKDRVLTHAKTVPEELECKAIVEAQKVKERYQGLTVEFEASNAKVQAQQVELEEREEQVRKLEQLCDSLVSEKNQLVQSSTTHQARLKEAESALDQSNAEVDSLTSHLAGLQGDRNWLITNGLVGAFEYLRQSESFVTLLYRLSAVAYKLGHHGGVYHGYFGCQQTDKITPAFQENRGKLQAEMVDALEAACNDPLPVYAELMDKVAEDGVGSLRQMLDPTEEYKEERVFYFTCYVYCSLDIF
ncbi:hypothetical protein Hanom_Chr07g00621081 [Helianthus anomalus]